MHVVMKAGSLTFHIVRLQEHFHISCFREKKNKLWLTKQPARLLRAASSSQPTARHWLEITHIDYQSLPIERPPPFP